MLFSFIVPNAIEGFMMNLSGISGFLLLPLRTSSSGVITLIFVNLHPFRTKFVYVVPNAINGIWHNLRKFGSKSTEIA
jgi:hypothetical protein